MVQIHSEIPVSLDSDSLQCALCTAWRLARTCAIIHALLHHVMHVARSLSPRMHAGRRHASLLKTDTQRLAENREGRGMLIVTKPC